MKKQINEYFKAKKIGILGFGREGKSSLAFLQTLKVDFSVNIYDERAISKLGLDKTINVFETVSLSKVDFSSYDVLLKSPGIPFAKIKKKHHSKIESQTSLFLKWFGNQSIGITGTKGKSTCTSLTHHLLQESGFNVLMGGNIGTPLFKLIPKLKKNSLVVAELSCHQLFKIKSSPHIAVLLNLYEEHLDYYKNTEEYFRSKLNIYQHQGKEDYFIFNKDDSRILDYLKEDESGQKSSFALKSKSADFLLNSKNELKTKKFRGKEKKIECSLLGQINFYNILPALAIGEIVGATKTNLFKALKSFKPLEHRLESIGTYNEIKFVNDSISTIPEASIAAVNALEDVDTLILGGYDRGIDYSLLETFLLKSKICNFVFFDESGKRIFENLKAKRKSFEKKKKLLLTNNFKACVSFCLKNTAAGKTCLLSPASSSYGIFKNFEDRGNQFKALVISLSTKM